MNPHHPIAAIVEASQHLQTVSLRQALRHSRTFKSILDEFNRHNSEGTSCQIYDASSKLLCISMLLSYLHALKYNFSVHLVANWLLLPVSQAKSNQVPPLTLIFTAPTYPAPLTSPKPRHNAIISRNYGILPGANTN